MYVFNVWRKWSCGVVCVWPRTNADTIGSMFIWFCYLEWIINGGKSIWCDLLTSKICQVKGTVLVLVRIFINKIKTYRPKKMIIRTMWEAVNSDIYFYYVGKLCTDITPTNSRAKWEDYIKAWNYITIDFHQEIGQEYSKIAQIIVKADRGKAIAWRSVSCKMTCYHIPDEKTL